MGWKNLYLFDKAGKCVQKNTLCVLDFYVHESMQRQGCGNILFEHMLQDMNVKAHQLAIDKPSQKFLCFLNKHYGLNQIVPQNNYFVVFSKFFGKCLSSTIQSLKIVSQNYLNEKFEL